MGLEVQVPASSFLFFSFLFFFSNIHTSDKLEIFFDHSILVNAALIALTHGVYTVFLAALTMKTVIIYSIGQRHECGFYRNRVSQFWPLPIE